MYVHTHTYIYIYVSYIDTLNYEVSRILPPGYSEKGSRMVAGYDCRPFSPPIVEP